MGSILSLLKKKGWANYLSAGPSHGGVGFEFFRISIDLTESGLGKVFFYLWGLISRDNGFFTN